MDRFIVESAITEGLKIKDLKSNMDRFIGSEQDDRIKKSII